MSNFKKTFSYGIPKVGTGLTNDNLYWRTKFPTTIKEYALIDYLNFASDDNCLAVTSSASVKLYNRHSRKLLNVFNQFTQTCYGARIRSDGRLMVAGCEDSHVRVFDVHNTKHMLRCFKGHASAVHRCDFTASGGYQVASFADDHTLRLWDLGTEQPLSTHSAHTDYVRAGACSTVSPFLLYSGSYDHTLRVWDTRASSSDTPVLCIDHGRPIDAVLVFQSDTLALSAGGSSVFVWDLIAGGNKLVDLSEYHSKSVTCATLCCGHSRLLTGSLDRHARIFDSGTFEMLHQLTYPSPLLSIAVSTDTGTIAAGMSDGLLTIQDRVDAANKQHTCDSEPSEKAVTTRRARKQKAPAKDQNGHPLAEYDDYFRKYEYSKVLDAILHKSLRRSKPELVMSVLDELIRREALDVALVGRPTRQIVSLVNFLVTLLRSLGGSTGVARTLTHVCLRLIAVYQQAVLDGDDEELGRAFAVLHEAVSRHVQYLEKAVCVESALDMLVSAGCTYRHLSDNCDGEFLNTYNSCLS